MIRKLTRTADDDQGPIRLTKTQGQVSLIPIHCKMKVADPDLGISSAKRQKLAAQTDGQTPYHPLLLNQHLLF